MDNNQKKDRLEQYRRIVELQDGRRCETWFAWANFMVIVNGGASAAILTTQTIAKFKMEFLLFLIGLAAILFAKTIDLVNLQKMITQYQQGYKNISDSSDEDSEKVFQESWNKPLNDYNKNIKPVYVLAFVSFAACIIGIATGTLNYFKICSCTVMIIDVVIFMSLLVYYLYLNFISKDSGIKL